MGVEGTCKKCGSDTYDYRCLNCIDKERHELKLQLDELQKESKFQIDLSSLWIKQLREALGEAMDALASDPDHDIGLQAGLELARRAVDLSKNQKCAFPSQFSGGDLCGNPLPCRVHG